MNNNSNFVGFATLGGFGLDFISDVRKVLKGTGFRIVLRGRNEDRKQHAGRTMSVNGYEYKSTHRMLRQSIPLRFSTYAGMYLRETSADATTSSPTMSEARGMVEAVRKIYAIHGKVVTNRS